MTDELDDPVEKETDEVDPSEESGEGVEGESIKDKAKGEWEDRYKNLQSHTTKVEQDNKELRDALMKLSGKVDGLTERREEVVEKPWIDNEEWDTKLRDDTVGGIKEIVKSLRREVAEVLIARDAALREELKKFDPTIVGLKDKIAELRKDPDFEGWEDEQLAVIAKKMKDDKVDDQSNKSDPPSKLPSRRGQPTKEKTSKEEDYWMKKLGYDDIKV